MISAYQAFDEHMAEMISAYQAFDEHMAVNQFQTLSSIGYEDISLYS